VMTNGRSAVAVLAEPTRLTILELLAEGPRPVGELAAQLPITRSAVSQHLKVLKEAGLVMDRQAGTRRFYQLNPEGIEEVREYFDRFWDMALARFKATVEEKRRESR
jgi:DNA-binding transcriptional ArsR family regulator